MSQESAPVPEPPARVFRWYLESMVEGGRQLRRIAVYPLPFRVGRLPGLPLTLASDSVSKEHAEFELQDGSLWVRDLGSKNGTFVNSSRTEAAPLREGDIVHIAQLEFRVGRQELDPEEGALEPSTVSLGTGPLPQRFVEGALELPELLDERLVTAVFQPLVSLPTGAVAGYEALGRGTHPRLPEGPRDLFRVAAGSGAQARLSRVFRERALELTEALPHDLTLFLNVHPDELTAPDLMASLADARERAPFRRLTLDLPESALADLALVDRLRGRLSRLGVSLAYDDFGSGQARLLELAEVPPQYLKFDMSFVRGIGAAPPSRQRMLNSLVSVARELLVYTVAEGVETSEEAEHCMRIGFTHAQGFYFGLPRPIEELAGS